MALDSLPLDILDALCHFVPTDDLLHLQLANSAFYPFAQRYIYRELDLQSLPDAVRCLKTLHSRRQISRYVRVFSLRLGPSVQLLRPFMKMLAAVLSEMSNLTSLDLVLPPSASIALAEARSRGTTYTRLTQFSCNFPFDDGVCTFLQGTPSLKELQLGEGPGGVLASTPMPQPALPECALPNLALYMGPSEAVTVLVPGRPLESVHLYSGDLSEEVLFALARSATPITIFGAFTHSLSPSILVCLASSLPHVHHLRIMTMYHSSNQPDDVSSHLMMLVPRHLLMLPSAHSHSMHRLCEYSPPFQR